MKSLALLKIVFSLGCVYSTFPIMSSLAGSVPVGTSSGVRLPSSSGTPVISPPPPVIVPSIAPTAPTPSVTVPSIAPTAPSVTAPSTTPSVTAPSTTPSVTLPPSTVTSPFEPTSTPVSRPTRSTPVFVISPAIQSVLNKTATQTLAELRAGGSTMGNIILPSTSANLTMPVSGITITPHNMAISPSTTNTPSVVATENNLSITPLQAGLTTATEVGSGNGVDITSNSFTVNIPPVSIVDDRSQVSTNATITTRNNENLDLVLTGTNEQVSNAAAFVAMAISADFSLDQIKTGTSIALTGTEFGQVGTLINSIAGLFDSVASSGESNSTNAINVSPEQLNTSILVFNQIVDDSNDETIVMLSENQDFLTIGKVLKRLRKAMEQ